MPHFKTKDGRSIYYETQSFESSKPVVVFLNGTMQNTVYWKTHSMPQIARDVHSPSLVLSASDDPFVTEAGARQLAVLCNGQHKHITGIGHSIPAEAPEFFSKTVLQFLDRP